jgi:hypothetical protein
VDCRQEGGGRLARKALGWFKGAIRAAGLSCLACRVIGAQGWALVRGCERPVVWPGCHTRGDHTRSAASPLSPVWNRVVLLAVLG